MEGDALKIVKMAAAACLKANGVAVSADDVVITGIFYHILNLANSGRRLLQVCDLSTVHPCWTA